MTEEPGKGNYWRETDSHLNQVIFFLGFVSPVVGVKVGYRDQADTGPFSCANALQERGRTSKHLSPFFT